MNCEQREYECIFLVYPKLIRLSYFKEFVFLTTHLARNSVFEIRTRPCDSYTTNNEV